MRNQERLIKAADEADWMQVVLNQGPPCFHLDDDGFCLRAQRWDGHYKIGKNKAIHKFVSLADLLRKLQRTSERRSTLTKTRGGSSARPVSKES